MLRKNKIKSLLTLLLLAAGAWTIAVTTIPVKQAGPFFFSQTTFDSTTIGGIGGVVKVYLVDAGPDTEKIGNIVFISAKNTVKHSATLVNYNSIAGVVVGGTRTGMQASTAVADTGTIAAITGQRVLVMERGRAWVLADTQAGFAPGLQVVPSAKSGMGGRLATRAASIDTFSRIFGKTIDTTISGKAVLVEVRVK